MLRFESLEDRQMLSGTADGDQLANLSVDPGISADVSYVDAGASNSGGGAGVVELPRGRPTLNPEETTFVADNGNLLRGPFASTEWGPPPPLSAIQSIKNFGANAIHLYGEVFNPNYTGVLGPGDEPGYAASRIDQMVQMTRDEGLYLVLTIGNGANNGTFNYDYVMDFWEFYAPRYANETHVLYEIQNEPHAWSAPYPQAALNMEADAYTLIRSLAPDTPILLFSFAVLGSGPQAVADVATVSTAASIDWSNAGVAVHGYAGHQATTTSIEYILNAGYPVVMTEYTASEWGSDRDVLATTLIAQLERLKVSWLSFQHIPPNFIGTAFTDPTAVRDVADRAGLSWTPDYGDWPVERGVFGNGGQPRATTGLTGTLRIEAEHFDTGGQGVAYSDADAGNQGGELRVGDDVDIELTADAGGGHHVGWTADGEWLEYTIFVTEPGVYNLRLRVASPTEAAARVILNGEDKSGTWLLPATGGSQNWTTVTKEVFLEYGRQKIRFEIVTGGFYLNWIELAPVTSGPIANDAYKILNRNSALAAEADTVNRTVEQSPYTGAANERWSLVHRGAGQYSITSVSNNWSWNTFYDSNGEPVTLAPWGYDGHPDRRFIIAPADNGYYRILVTDGGLSVEVGGASLADGAPVQQHEYQGDNHQQWGILSPSAPSIPAGLLAAWGDSIGVLGDYNQDGVVDAADYVTWRHSLGMMMAAPYDGADGNGNMMIDAGDHAIWKASYGNTDESFRIDLSWGAAPGAASYNIQRSRTSGGPYTTITTDVTNTSYSDAVIPDGGSYYYAVNAVGPGGESLISGEAKPANLHAHAQFDETSGTSASDSTGNGWTGTLVNGALWSQGTIGNAVDLDGTNDHVRLPTGVVNGLTRVTVAAWVRLDSVSTWSRIFDFGSGTSVNMFLTPRSGITSLPAFAITTSGSGGEQRINSSAAISANVWTHVAVTFGGGSGVLYVDGMEVGRNDTMSLTPSSLGATTQNYIGRSQYADPYLNGRVDDFRIYDDVLSAAAIAALAAPGQSAASIGVASFSGDSHVTELSAPGSAVTSSSEEVRPNGELLSTSADSLSRAVQDDTGLTGQLDDYAYLALRPVGIADASRNTSVLSTASNLLQRSHGSDAAARQLFEATRVQIDQRPGDFAASHRHAVDKAISEIGGDSVRWFKALHNELLNELIGRGNRLPALPQAKT